MYGVHVRERKDQRPGDFPHPTMRLDVHTSLQVRRSPNCQLNPPQRLESLLTALKTEALKRSYEEW